MLFSEFIKSEFLISGRETSLYENVVLDGTVYRPRVNVLYVKAMSDKTVPVDGSVFFTRD